MPKMPKSCRECPFYKITGTCDILSAWNNFMPKMPKSCRECPFYEIIGICDILSAWNNFMPVLVPSEGKHSDCPLKEVEEE